MPGGSLHAECADHVDALADGHAERRIERSAADDQHGGVLQRIDDRQRRQLAAMRSEHLDAPQYGRVQRAHAQRRAQPCNQPLERKRGIGRQRDRDGGFPLVLNARDRRHDGSVHRGDLQAEHAGGRFASGRAGFGDDHGGWLDRDEGGRRIGPFGFDDGEGAGCAQRFDEVGRRLFGDHDDRTLKRHKRRTQRTVTTACDDRPRLLTPRQRHRKITRHCSWRGRERRRQ
jgi:hypothetical protein